VRGLVLSLFPGIDVLGRGFEAAGYCVVRGPDLILGGDIRDFHALPGRFDGVIGGSPCPDFSRARRAPPSGDGLAMIREFERVVLEARPTWWLLENVPASPTVVLPGWGHQRLDLDARDFGSEQRRLRHIQFGHQAGRVLVMPRPAARSGGEATCLASEISRPGRRAFGRFCELQGLPSTFALPSFTLSARYRAVGNAVHFDVARALGEAVAAARDPSQVRLCACRCGRPVTGKALSAGPACRKRLERAV
jgi:DNA (cytosine-5)-methyltransferase 1